MKIKSSEALLKIELKTKKKWGGSKIIDKDFDQLKKLGPEDGIKSQWKSYYYVLRTDRLDDNSRIRGHFQIQRRHKRR